jgi:hypothetical protein
MPRGPNQLTMIADGGLVTEPSARQSSPPVLACEGLDRSLVDGLDEPVSLAEEIIASGD